MKSKTSRLRRRIKENVEDSETRATWKKSPVCRVAENKQLRSEDEAMPRLKAVDLKRTAAAFPANTGIGTDGFHPKMPLDRTDSLCKVIVVASWDNVEVANNSVHNRVFS